MAKACSVGFVGALLVLSCAASAGSYSRSAGAVVDPVAVPPSNGTAACDDARETLQELNAALGRFAARVKRAEADVQKARAAWAAAKAKRDGETDPRKKTALGLEVNSTGLALANAKHELEETNSEGKKLEKLLGTLGATAAAQCKKADPAPAAVVNQFVVPPDNGTAACKTLRNQMIHLLDELRKARKNKAFQFLDARINEIRERQLDTRIARLDAELNEIAAKAAKACAPDTTPPAVPSGLGATGGAQQIVLDWADNSEDDLAGYRVYRDGALIATTTTSAHTDTGLGEYATHTYAVTAFDKKGNESAKSGEAKATTDPPDFSGTYRGTWGGTFNAPNGCTIQQGGSAVFVIAKTDSAGSYSVTQTLGGYLYEYSAPPDCTKRNIRDATFNRTASFSEGKLVGPSFSVTGSKLAGGWTMPIAGGTETVTFEASR